MLTRIIKFLVIISIINVSCVGMKHQASNKSQSVNYETFYINDSTMQYFIKPLMFKAENKDKTEVDFTFRSSAGDVNQVTMNFSIISNTKQPKTEFILLKGDTLHKVTVDKKLYQELKDNKCVYRYSSTLPYADLNDFLTSDTYVLEVNKEKLFPTKATQKKVEDIILKLFEFELQQ